MNVPKPDRALEKAMRRAAQKKQHALRRMIDALAEGKTQHFQNCERDYDRLWDKWNRTRNAWVAAQVAHDAALRKARWAKEPPYQPRTLEEAVFMQRCAFGLVIHRPSPIVKISGW